MYTSMQLMLDSYCFISFSESIGLFKCLSWFSNVRQHVYIFPYMCRS
uniref:Uncharacterized protein n=1 Tax=Rhizophora mucronata TaxID=61149 RepID=A0A2P2Q639_RHIMU